MEDFNKQQRELETRWAFMDTLIAYLKLPDETKHAAVIKSANEISHNCSDILTDTRYLEQRMKLLVTKDKAEWARWLFNLAYHRSKYYELILTLSPYQGMNGGSIDYDSEDMEVTLRGPLAKALIDSFRMGMPDGEADVPHAKGIVFYSDLSLPIPNASYDLRGDEAMKPKEST